MTAHQTISHEIAASIRGDILTNRYHRGDRLPSERELAVRFNASRGAVREGLSQLELLGLIRTLPGGARVQPIEAASLGVLGPMLELNEIPDPQLVDQFLETFGALASLTARSAVAKASQEELNQLDQLIVNIARQSNDFAAVQPHWREFLEQLSTIADNLVVRLISNDLRTQFLEHMMGLWVSSDFRPRIVKKTLTGLREAITANDSDKAGSVIQCHFDELRVAASTALAASGSNRQESDASGT